MNYKRHKFGPETESTIPTLFGFEDSRPPKRLKLAAWQPLSPLERAEKTII